MPTATSTNGTANGDSNSASSRPASSYAHGYGSAPPPLPAPTDPTAEYLPGGSQAYGYLAGPRVLQRAIDDITRAFGPELYEFMLLDAAVAGSFSKIATGVLSGRVHVVPTVKRVPGRATTMEMERSEDVAENNRQNLEHLERPIVDVLKEMLYAMAFGNINAEVIEHKELVDGKRSLRAIAPKPWWAWRFGVDAAGNVLGVVPTQGVYGVSALSGNAPPLTPLASDADGGILGMGPLLDPSHFAILSWDQRGGNPQGQSILRPCYSWWNEKRQALPEYRKFIKRFAAPKPVATLDPTLAGQIVPQIDPVTLQQIPGATESIMLSVLKVMQQWDNDLAIVLPGTTVNMMEPRTDGQGFSKFYDFCDRMIFQAILQSASAVMEAKHDSQAKAQVSEDGTGSLYRFIGGWLGRWVRKILYRLNVINYGPEAARLYTGEVMIGEDEHQNIPETLKAFASVGYTADPSQFAAMDAMANLPEREVVDEEEGVADEGQAAGDEEGDGKDTAADDETDDEASSLPSDEWYDDEEEDVGESAAGGGTSGPGRAAFNCGTGHGGFKPGNHCQPGGGGGEHAGSHLAHPGKAKRAASARARKSAAKGGAGHKGGSAAKKSTAKPARPKKSPGPKPPKRLKTGKAKAQPTAPTKGTSKSSPSASASASSSRGTTVGKAEHVHAAEVEHRVTTAVGGRSVGRRNGKDQPMDVLVRGADGTRHGLEVKTLLKGEKRNVTMHPDALLRKAEYATKRPGREVHTIAFDRRAVHENGAHADKYSGHEIYYKRGAGAFALSKMHKVGSADELKSLINTPNAKLPAAARADSGWPPKGQALAKLKADAEKAHASRVLKDRTRKQRLSAERKAAEASVSAGAS